MISRLLRKKSGPIGLDIGTRSVKMIQLDADRTRVLAAARHEFSFDAAKPDGVVSKDGDSLTRVLRSLADERGFHGSEAILCLSDRHLFLQNIRVPKSEPAALDRLVQQEAAGRIPFAIQEAEIRYLEAADVRQGDQILREVILLACHRPVLEALLTQVEAAGLRPCAVDVEASAILRAYVVQCRRQNDRGLRTMFVHVGYSNTIVVISQAEDILFVKYLPLGGKQIDEAVGKSLDADVVRAASVRRNNGDRRSDQQDVELSRAIFDASRPVVERLAAELSMCVRYHSVTFRGQPMEKVILGGGEGDLQLLEVFQKKLGIKCELSDPFRGIATSLGVNRRGQWDIAAGLALRELN